MSAETTCVRLMHEEDIPLGLALCRFAGWNQLEDDWQRFLALNFERVFVAEYEGQPCGTASLTCYGTDLAWIGMVLVHPDFQRRGVASALIRHGLSTLREAKLRCIKLDATDLGRAVYSKLDFEDERPIYRCLCPRAPARSGPALPPISERDWEAVAAFDLEVFGANRLPLLQRLAYDGSTAIVRSADGVEGFGFARSGFDASFLGPIVARDSDTARALAKSLLSTRTCATKPVYWDLLPDNTGALALADSLGFQVARRLMRMRFGTPLRNGILEAMYAAAGFEAG